MGALGRACKATPDQGNGRCVSWLPGFPKYQERLTPENAALLSLTIQSGCSPGSGHPRGGLEAERRRGQGGEGFRSADHRVRHVAGDMWADRLRERHIPRYGIPIITRTPSTRVTSPNLEGREGGRPQEVISPAFRPKPAWLFPRSCVRAGYEVYGATDASGDFSEQARQRSAADG